MTRREWIAGLPLGIALFDQNVAGQNVAETVQIAVTAERSFGRELLRGMIASKPRENVFISPLSVFLALHMAENGAGGENSGLARSLQVALHGLFDRLFNHWIISRRARGLGAGI